MKEFRLMYAKCLQKVIHLSEFSKISIKQMDKIYQVKKRIRIHGAWVMTFFNWTYDSVMTFLFDPRFWWSHNQSARPHILINIGHFLLKNMNKGCVNHQLIFCDTTWFFLYGVYGNHGVKFSGNFDQATTNALFDDLVI